MLSKREDGFHGIETVMHSVDLCDELTITLTAKGHRGVKLSIDGAPHLPTDGKNIVYTAAAEFLDRCGIDAEVSIRLVKRIPVAAGLAGGSSDAAATLRGMNRLFARPLSASALMSIAESLGSDVPYCLVGGTALCYGRGEKMNRLFDGLRLHAVIAVGNEHVSTPQAYGALDKLYSDFDGSVPIQGTEMLQELLDGLADGTLPSSLYNIFEEAILPTCPAASAIKARLLELGATHAMMSGSGPSVFGIFKSTAEAERAASVLSSEGISAHSASSVV